MKKKDLSIVILNYNTRELLRDCLNSIEKNKGDLNLEILVADNGSHDNSLGMVKNNFPKVKIVANKDNLGFAKGNNRALKKVTADFVLLLNPDTIVHPQALTTCLDFIKQNDQVGAVTCRVELAEGKLDEACHRGFPTPWNAFCYFSGLIKIFPREKIFAGYLLGHLDKKIVHQIDSASGAFLLIRAKVGRELGWLDEDFFWYGEDLDFCYRLKQKGWQIFFLPQVKITHYKGMASGIKKHSAKISQASRKTKLESAKASTEAMRLFYRKHYFEKYPKVITWLVLKMINLLEFIRIRRVK